MIAIHTKYLPITNARGSRIKASAPGYKSVTIPYPHELSGVMCHYEAVKAFVAKNALEVTVSDMCYGDSADGRGFSFVFACSRVC
jgi:hypothetical protein